MKYNTQKFSYTNISSQNKNILILGKTGQGKSYFSNLLLQMNPQQQKVVKFPVYNKLESGTVTCQAEINQNVTYGNETITLNILDTPGIFDTKDDRTKVYQYQNKPRSILNIENIDSAAIKSPFQKKFNKIFFVFSATEKIDIHQKALLESLKIMVGNLKNITVIVTKCQYKHDENESDAENLNCLAQYQNTIKNHFKQYDIQDIYFITNQPFTYYLKANDEVSLFYQQQWKNLFLSMKSSPIIYVKLWSALSTLEKNQIGQFFNYRIGQTKEQKKQEYISNISQQENQLTQMVTSHDQSLETIQNQTSIQQTQKIQDFLATFNQEKQQLQEELVRKKEGYLQAQQKQLEDCKEYFEDEIKRIAKRYKGK